MITHLLFDHDGVLVETEYWYFEATRKALAKLGINMSFDDYKQHLIDGSSNWTRAVENEIPQTEINAARAWRDARYRHYLANEDIDIPGVSQVLPTLSKRFQMAVITTSKRVDFELIHRRRELLKEMSFVLCREDYVNAKPHPEPYQAGLRKFGIRPENAVVIEDSKRGLASAEAANILTIKVYNKFVAHQEADADYEVQSLQELPGLLQSINGEKSDTCV